MKSFRKTIGIMCLSSSLVLINSQSIFAQSQTCAPLRGVNLAGAEFGQKIPGTFGRDYIYPGERTIAYFAAQGATAIRLPFLWSRLQRELGAPFDNAELARLSQTVSTITNNGMKVILDPHDHARYKGAKIGTSHVTFAHFSNFWGRLAREFKNDDNVLFSLTNEPYDMSARIWLRAANAAIEAIRKEGANNIILVPGIHFTGAHSWFAEWEGGNNSRVMKGVVDPLNNFAYDFHQYLDHDFSGTQPECSQSKRALAAIEKLSKWLKKQNVKGYLGEFGSSQDQQCINAILALTDHINQRPKQWLGWTYWAAGEWWPTDYFLSVQPQSEEQILPQWRALKQQMQTSNCN